MKIIAKPATCCASWRLLNARRSRRRRWRRAKKPRMNSTKKCDDHRRRSVGSSTPSGSAMARDARPAGEDDDGAEPDARAGSAPGGRCRRACPPSARSGSTAEMITSTMREPFSSSTPVHAPAAPDEQHDVEHEEEDDGEEDRPPPPSARLPVLRDPHVSRSTERDEPADLVAVEPGVGQAHPPHDVREARPRSASWVTKLRASRRGTRRGLRPRTSASIQTQASISLSSTRRSSAARCASRSRPAGLTSTTRIAGDIAVSPRAPRAQPSSPLSLGIEPPTPAGVDDDDLLLVARALAEDRAGPTVSAHHEQRQIDRADPEALGLDALAGTRAWRSTNVLSSRIAHRLDEDLLELRLLGAELADAQELDQLAQHLGPLARPGRAGASPCRR